MFFRSLFYERTVLSILERVERLPLHIQVEVATRVGNFINHAKSVGDAVPLGRLLEVARNEREKIVTQSEDPVLARWAGPALAEGWCVAMLGVSEESMEKNSAIAIIVAIEDFVTKCAEIRRNG